MAADPSISLPPSRFSRPTFADAAAIRPARGEGGGIGARRERRGKRVHDRSRHGPEVPPVGGVLLAPGEGDDDDDDDVEDVEDVEDVDGGSR